MFAVKEHLDKIDLSQSNIFKINIESLSEFFNNNCLILTKHCRKELNIPGMFIGNGMLKKLLHKGHVCPWWLCFTFDNPLRKIIHDPIKILSPYVHPGDTAIDIGPGMGYFSIPMAELVGPKGRVIAIDIQQKMLSFLMARAQKKSIADRIKTHLAGPDSIGFGHKADFILAFWMVHEVPDRKKFLSEIRDLLKPQGLFLMVEPMIHLSKNIFLQEVEMAKELGFGIKDYPEIRMSKSALFTPGGK